MLASFDLPPFNPRKGLPTPVTATAPNFPTTFADPSPSPPPGPMADESWPAKGKGKRLAGGPGVDGRGRASNQELPASSAPQVVRRHRHRRQNIAAAVWGPHLPGEAPVPARGFDILLDHVSRAVYQRSLAQADGWAISSGTRYSQLALD